MHKRYKRFRWHQYFYSEIQDAVRFLVPQNSSILFIGPYHYDYVKDLNPSDLTIVVPNTESVSVVLHDDIHVIFANYDKFVPARKFDIVIIFYAAGFANDLNRLLENIKTALTPSSRILLLQNNHLWNPMLRIGERFRLKNAERTQNWLSIRDLHAYLSAAGLEITRSYSKTLIPAKIYALGSLINWLAVFFPFFDNLKINQFILARLLPERIYPGSKSLTICLTVRDEVENIEPMIQTIPEIASEQEVVFVEGHSTDGTYEEIQRLIPLYPEKNIRVLKQTGIGQGDAIRMGFHQAKGDIIILLEGDGTCDANDIKYFYEAIAKGWLEFVEGSRFVYPIKRTAMAPINQIGNMIFARWFSWFFKEHMTDVLSGIKAITREGFEKIYLQWGSLGLNDPFGDFELLYGAGRYGLKVGEIPIHYYPRAYGETKTRVIKHGSLLFRLTLNGYIIFRRLYAPQEK